MSCSAELSIIFLLSQGHIGEILIWGNRVILPLRLADYFNFDIAGQLFV